MCELAITMLHMFISSWNNYWHVPEVVKLYETSNESDVATPSGENKDSRTWTALHSWYYWALSFVEAFSQGTTHKVKVSLQLPTEDPAFSVSATKFGRDFFFFFEHQNSFPPLWLAFMDSEPRRRMWHLQLNANEMGSPPSRKRDWRHKCWFSEIEKPRVNNRGLKIDLLTTGKDWTTSEKLHRSSKLSDWV